MACQSGPFGPWLTVRRGAAVPVTALPAAMPMRRRPKSKARMRVCGRSGMTWNQAHLVHVHAHQAPRGEPAILVRQVEQQRLVEWQREPRVVLDLAFELAGLPAGV